ncbi:hypothetical protein CHS0354_006122 [Potamilus streckersoni]|uniref:Syntaxin-18 n=1 Tax=Potamilus streckersoni TaxID=2493646 RepID=A0AAE0W1K5_9BIVA|nr:hypothetical protein CHS0354_006122 [Potamilus streckersoni]
MADITNLYKALVKSIKTRNKNVNEGKSEVKGNHIFPVSKHQGDFESRSKEMVMALSKLKDFLLEHRKGYVSAGSHLSADTLKMTDAERDQIDTEAQRIIKHCQENIGIIRQNAEHQKVHPQLKEHRESVINLLHTYLKEVCKIYSEQKAVRVKRVVDRKRISRIEPERKFVRASGRVNEKNSSTNARIAADTLISASPPKIAKKTALIEDNPFDDEDDVSPEEAQMFEQENKALFEEMNSLAAEVSQIQGKVMEIARLQEIFTEKVLEQEGDINKIADTTVKSTENIKDGNEEIREAMKNNAGFRVWILFFLLVLTFTLLFLDWYSG